MRRRWEASWLSPSLPRVAARAVQFTEEEGAIVRFLPSDVISLCPPLIITRAELDALFDALALALDRTLDWARRERLVIG